MNSLWVWIVVGILVVMAGFRLASAGRKGDMAKEKIKQGATVIDVRTPGEYASGHYEGATNIPVQELQGRLGELGDKQKPVVVYCASGMRSASAATLLTAAGFTDVVNAGALGNLKP
jgi:phage shock protein E